MDTLKLTDTNTDDGPFAAEIRMQTRDLSLESLESLDGSVLLQTIRQTESREEYFAAHSSHSSHSSHGTAAW